MADEFCRKVDWNNIADAKIFFRKLCLPSPIKQKVFLILNNKAGYFNTWFNVFTLEGYHDYIGFNLMEDEI